MGEHIRWGLDPGVAEVVAELHGAAVARGVAEAEDGERTVALRVKEWLIAEGGLSEREAGMMCIEAAIRRLRQDGPPMKGWTRRELYVAAGFRSGGTFDSIRKAAGLDPAESGGSGNNRKYSRAEVKKLIAAVLAGSFQRKGEIAQSWRDLIES